MSAPPVTPDADARALPAPLAALAKRPLVAAFLLCLATRLLAIAVLGTVGDYHVFADPEAQTEAHWYPLYRALAGWLWAASAGSVGVFVAWHLALHCALGPIVFATARRLELGELVGWFAVLGVAALPYYVSVAARQPQVGVVVTFVAATFWCFLLWRDRGYDWSVGSIFAALCATSALIRPNLLLTEAGLYAFALASVCTGSGDRRTLGRIFASGLLVAALLGGLVLESRARTGHWSPFQPIAGYNTWLGHNPRVNEYLKRYDILSVEDVTRTYGLPEEVRDIADPYEQDAALGELGMAHIAENPWLTVENTLWKAWRWWDVRLEDAEKNPLWWNAIYTVPYVVYGSLAIVGALLLLRRRRGTALGLVSLVLATYWLPHLFFFPTIRMRMTTEFLLLLLAAVPAAALTATLWQRGRAGGDQGGGSATPSKRGSAHSGIAK